MCEYCFFQFILYNGKLYIEFISLPSVMGTCGKCLYRVPDLVVPPSKVWLLDERVS